MLESYIVDGMDWDWSFERTFAMSLYVFWTYVDWAGYGMEIYDLI